MATRPKDKGTMAETAVVEYLEAQGIGALRPALKGTADIGDVVTESAIFQVKNCAQLHIPQWLRDTEEQRVRAKRWMGFLVMKPKGIGKQRIDQWWTVMLRSDWEVLYRFAGSPNLPLLRSYSPQFRFGAQMLALNSMGIVTAPFRKDIEAEFGGDKYVLMGLGVATMLLRSAREAVLHDPDVEAG